MRKLITVSQVFDVERDNVEIEPFDSYTFEYRVIYKGRYVGRVETLELARAFGTEWRPA